MTDFIDLVQEGQLTTLWLDRPQSYNAFNYEMVDRLARELTALATDDRVGAVIISGRGKAFCAGGDLKWALGFEFGPPAAFHELAARFHAAILEIRRMPKPVIAAINGPAAGGGFSLALACDFRVMDVKASLRQAYTSNGLCIDGGGTFTLPRLLGLARALEIAAFDQPIDSEQALSWGLITQTAPAGQAYQEALTMARTLTARSLNSFAWSKKLLTDSFNTSFETQIEHERYGLEQCAAHPDGQEGLKAFTEKRRPVFGGLS